MRFAFLFLVLATLHVTTSADDGQTPKPVDVDRLLQQANDAGRLPEGVVVRVSTHVWTAGSREKDSFKKSWEFTADEVRRITDEVSGISEPAKTLPFDSRRLCHDLANGRMTEIRNNQGPGDPVRFALALYNQGERKIEVLVDGKPVISLSESHLAPGYHEPHAIHFATLHEQLSSQAQAVFAETYAKGREILIKAARNDSWPKGMVVRIGADAFDSGEDWRLEEDWEFTDGKVHRIKIEKTKKEEWIRRREQSLPFAGSAISKQLVNGRAFEIQASDSIEVPLLLADHEGALGGRHIKVTIGDDTVLDLYEHCTGAGYGITQAHAFAKLYEELASQARSTFAESSKQGGATDAARTAPNKPPRIDD